MPPRPRRPAIRYRLARTMPGRKPRAETGAAGGGTTAIAGASVVAVSLDAGSKAPQDPQNRCPAGARPPQFAQTTTEELVKVRQDNIEAMTVSARIAPSGALLLLLFVGVQASMDSSAAQRSERAWPPITAETKPWTRWWWQGSAL